MSLGVKNLKVFVFDLDDTLYLERDYVLSGLKAIQEHYTSDEQLATFDEEERKKRKTLLEEFVKNTLTMVEAGCPSAITACLSRYRSIRHYYGDKEKEMIEIYRSHRPNIKLPGDSLSILEHLKQLHKRLDSRVWTFIITDGDKARQANKLKALGLGSLVNGWIINHLPGTAKPSFDSFLTVQHRFRHSGLEPFEFVYIGDNPEKDFFAPAQLGWYTIRIKRRFGLHEGEKSRRDVALEVKSMSEITQHLEKV